MSDVADGLPLLRACKQINQEASTVLYGRNKFYFDDTPHQRGATTVTCDFMFLYQWLRNIGMQNRMRLRTIELYFNTDQFYYSRGEHSRLSGAATTQNFAKHLIDAFELLARGHALSKLEINFDLPSNNHGRLFRALFYNVQESGLIWQLGQITGLQELLCDRGQMDRYSALYPASYGLFKRLKKRMEAKEVTGKAAHHPQGLDEQIMTLEDEQRKLKQKVLETDRQCRKDVRRIREIDDVLSIHQGNAVETIGNESAAKDCLAGPSNRKHHV
ncbi:hypothetical protein MMC08_000693 [Hypocenomyce scalaris]|nr:hypothetical protein [Hypocenomyce scalaris]